VSRTLAFGDDGSDGAERCWDWIASHTWVGWGLEVVTTAAPADMHPVAPEDAELHRWESDRPRDVAGLGFDSVEYLRAEVDPRVALIAREWDLVAIGPRGAGVLKALHLGSTADWLLRQPASPLLIAHRGEPVQRLMVCADGSDHALRAIQTLAALPLLARAAVTVMAVDDGRIDSRAAIDVATNLLEPSGAEIDEVIRKGRPTKVILTEIQQAQPDLVVMGARGLGGLKRLVLGSTTSAVSGSADVSLLVAHALEA
jgi:nucleotide-binding universal stress UspA family protein